MIVKDEAEILPRLFESCRELIDYWVICDTGSTDGTQELIRRELDAIPGELHQREWVNFGVNRSELLALGRGKSDYLLLLDADMTIRQVAPIGTLTAGAYLLRQPAGAFEYRTKRLVRGDRRWRYVGTTHEYIESADGAEEIETLDALVVEHHADGHSWSEKYERDIGLLTRDLQENPNDARAQFYLAQTFRDLAAQTENKHMLANAADHYQRRAEMPGWEEETYFAQYQVGALADRLGDWPRAADAYVRAWEIRPRRLEAVHSLAAGLRERKCYQAAHRFTRMGASLQPLPTPDDILFVAPWVYEWGILFEYSVTSYWVGEYRNSLAACKRLLDIPSLPDHYRDLTIANLQHAVRESVRVEAERPRRPRKLKHTGTPTRGLPAPDELTPPELRDSALAGRLAESCGMPVADVERYLMRTGRPVAVSVKALGGLPVRIRPGTGDVLALDRASVRAPYLPDPELGEPALIVDVGARIGITSLHFGHLYPSARLVVVEPDQDDLDLCAENLRPLSARTMLVEAAIADRAASSGNAIATLTLDSLLERAACDTVVDHLKLDIGESLAAALRGGGPWSARVRSIAAAVDGDAATQAAVRELVGLGFDAHPSEGWVSGTRAVANAHGSKRRLGR